MICKAETSMNPVYAGCLMILPHILGSITVSDDWGITYNIESILSKYRESAKPYTLRYAAIPVKEPEPRHPDLNLERDMPVRWVYLASRYYGD